MTEEKRIVVDVGNAMEMLQASPELARAMNELVLGGPMAKVLEDADQIVQIVVAFRDAHQISCVEKIYDDDDVIVNAMTLIEQLIEAVGYYEYPDE